MHRLVLADDSQTIQKVVELSFAGEEIEIRSFADGISALEYLRDQPVDVLVADVSLPFIHGYDLCEEVRKNPRTADVPVILLSGTFELFDAIRAEQVGCSRHLKKPFETTRLVEMVTALLAAPPGQAHPAGEGRSSGVVFDIPFLPLDSEPIFILSPEQCRAAPAWLTRETGPASNPAVVLETHSGPEGGPESSAPWGPSQPVSAGLLTEEEIERVVGKVMERLPAEIRRLIPQVAAELQRSGK